MTVTITAQDGLRARDNLRWIADQWPRLRAALDPTRGNAHTDMPTAPEQHPAPINLHISDLMHEIETETRQLAAVLLDETDDWSPSTSTMPGLLYDVALRYGHWTAGDHSTALAFLGWAEDYQHRVHRALTKPAPPTYIGPCRVTECEGELYLRPGRGTTTCPHCGTETDAAEQVEWIGEQFEQRLMTPAELASALKVLGQPVPMGTIKSWIHRERLPEVVDGLYRVSDAQKLALARKTRGRIAS